MPPPLSPTADLPPVEIVPVTAVKPHPANPRLGDVEAILASIRANGFFRPLVVQRSTAYVLAGNHRLKAAIAGGQSTVPVIWADVDDLRALEILAVDNATSDKGTYDDRQLADLLAGVQARGTLAATGYSPAALEQLFDRLSGSKDQSSQLKQKWEVIVGPADLAVLEELRKELAATGIRGQLREAE